MARATSKVQSVRPRASTTLKGHNKSKVTAVLRSNMLSTRLVAGIVKSSFGPKGLDKMFLDKVGGIHMTSDGATILGKAESNHPIARLIAELGKSVDTEVGDGVISTVILMNALVEQAVTLVERGVHPASIVSGYTLALDKALAELGRMAEPVPPDSKEWLTKVVATSMHTKLAVKGSRDLPELLASAGIQTAERRGEKLTLDTRKIAIRRVPGGGLSDSRLVRGYVIGKDLISRDMPKRLENVKIVVGDVSLVVKKTVADHKISMTDPTTVAKLGLDRRARLKEMGDRIIASGANVLFNREGCDDLVAYQLAQAGIMAVRHVKIEDVAHIAEATGATVVDAKRDIRPEDLGFAELVEERTVIGAGRSDKWVFIEGCKDPRALTLVLRGASMPLLDEAERSVHDGLRIAKDLMERPAVVAGGGAVEAEIASRIRRWSTSLEGREQVAAEAFADALEEIPQALASAIGMHALDAIVEMRSRHVQGGRWFGVDAADKKVMDMYERGVVEPIAVKEEVLKAATETACLVLRVDGVFDKEKPRAYRRRSEMPKGEEEGLSRSKKSELFHDRANKFYRNRNRPTDARYPL